MIKLNKIIAATCAVAMLSCSLTALADTEFSIVNPYTYSVALSSSNGPAPTYGKDWHAWLPPNGIAASLTFKDGAFVCEPGKDENGNYIYAFTGFGRINQNSSPGLVKGKMMYEFSFSTDNLRKEEGGAGFDSLDFGRTAISFYGYPSGGSKQEMAGVRLLHESNSDRYAVTFFKNGTSPTRSIESEYLLSMADFGTWYTVRMEVNMYSGSINYYIRQKDSDEWLATVANVPLSKGSVKFVAASPSHTGTEMTNCDMRVRLRDFSYTIEQVDVKDVAVTETEDKVIATALMANDTAELATPNSPILVLALYDSIGRLQNIGYNKLSAADLTKRASDTTMPSDADYKQLTTTLQKPNSSYTAKTYILKSMTELYALILPQ